MVVDVIITLIGRIVDIITNLECWCISVGIFFDEKAYIISSIKKFMISFTIIRIIFLFKSYPFNIFQLKIIEKILKAIIAIMIIVFISSSL